MWNFYTDHLNREYLIFREILIKRRGVALEDLLRQMNCDHRTLINQIVEINEMFDAQKIIVKNGEVRLNENLSLWPTKVYKVFYSGNLELNILEYLFLNNNLCAANIAASFNISESTVYRVIKSIDKNLAHFGLHIDLENFEIVGEEVSILKVMSQFYIEKGFVSGFDHFEIFDCFVFDLFDKLLVEFEQENYRIYFASFQWFIFAALVRVKHKKN